MRLDTDSYRTPLPAQPTLVLTPAAPTTLDDLVATASSTDPLGESIDLVYEWWRTDASGQEAKQDLASSSVLHHKTARDETWRVRVTPRTAFTGRIGEAAEATVTIQNTAPEVQSVGFSTYEPHIRESLDSFVNIFDVDRDGASPAYQWWRNGAPIEGARSGRLDLRTVADLASGDELELRVIASDGTATSGELRSDVVSVLDDELRWRGLLPDRSVRDAWQFWDPLHRRVLVMYETSVGTEMWEVAIESGNEKPRYVQLPEPTAWPGMDVLSTGATVYDAANRRAVFVGVGFGEEGPTTSVWSLDLRQRSRPVWEELETEGALVPPPRYGPGVLYEEQSQRVWRLGGVDVDTLISQDDVWVLDVSVATPTWASERALPEPTAAPTIVSIPNEPRAFLFGGWDSFSGLTQHRRVLELRFGSGATEIVEHNPLPTAMAGAFGAFVPSDSDPLQDRIYVGSGFDIEFNPVDEIYGFELNAEDPAPTPLGGISEYPRALALVGQRVAVYDEASRRILIESSGVETDLAWGRARGFWAFEPETQDWAPFARYGIDQPPALAFAMNVFERVWGGVQARLRPAEEAMWRYDFGAKAFVPKAPNDNMPAARAAVVVPADRFPRIGFGGVDGWPGDGPLVDPAPWVWSFDLEAMTLDEETSPLGTRYGHMVFRCGSGDYYFGGRDGIGLLADTGELDCDDDTGICGHLSSIVAPEAAPSPRAFARALTEVVGVGNTALLVGGEGADSTLWRFKCTGPGTPRWDVAPTTGTPPSPRYGHSMNTMSNETPYLITGGDLSLPATDAWQIIDNGDDSFTWLPLVPEGGPQPPTRRHHVAIWNDAEHALLIYGGQRPGFESVAYADLWQLRIPED